MYIKLNIQQFKTQHEVKAKKLVHYITTKTIVYLHIKFCDVKYRSTFTQLFKNRQDKCVDMLTQKVSLWLKLIDFDVGMHSDMFIHALTLQVRLYYYYQLSGK